ncbi:hypothetical protein DOTSEDRAFT_31429 [Lecanosticta acicola]|uniref:SP-RING-type domain-containing protein n=1 Tax=Lecanosticta acicola TaxID=111012 RepID=A0AAI8YY30_9PEZI|nr:hypothetical protein DOTSEDRAFT_31429 [Lecanosticta acicola]
MASRARQSTATPAPRRSEGPLARSGSSALPEYQTPTYPLNPAAQRALANLTRTHDLRTLTTRLNAAQETLNTAAVDVNDRLTDRNGRVASVRQRRDKEREENGEEDEGDESLEEMERAMNEMKQKVDGMTKRMEETMRKILDGKKDVQFMEQSVNAAAEDTRNNASTQASTLNTRSQRTRQSQRNAEDEGNGEDGEDDDDDDENDGISDFQPTDPAAGTQPEQAPINIFRSKLEDAKTRYQSHSMGDRYGKDNDYINFRRAVHDAQYPGDEVPMLPPSEWFNEDGTVAAPGHTARRGGGEEDESDDDIAIEKATISTKCPLTLREFKDPISSTKCSHSYEKTAILELFGRSAHVRCPVGGCSEALTKKDLRKDPVIVRKIQRLQKAKRVQQEQDQDEDEDEEDDAPRGTQRRRAQTIDDDDAANIEDEDDDDSPMKLETQTTHSVGPPQPPRPSQAIDLDDGSDEDEVTLD